MIKFLFFIASFFIVTVTADAAIIEIDTKNRLLTLYEDDGTIIEYPIAVGRSGTQWKGTKTITKKAEWPNWYPTEKARKRYPHLPKVVKAGEDNPLGARALYLGNSLYRIHGTNDPESIGRAASSGCFRMFNEHVIDLYERVDVGTVVVVR